MTNVIKRVALDTEIAAPFVAELAALKTNEDFQKAFAQAINEFKESTIRLAVIFTSWANTDRDAAILFAEENGFSRCTMSRLEAIACGTLDTRLLAPHNRSVNKMVRLPIHEQRRLLDEGVPMVLADKPEQHLIVDPTVLLKEQVAQVFSFDGVRSLAEQRAYLEEMKLRAEASRESKVFDVVGTHITVYRPANINIADIISKLKPAQRARLLKQA